MPNEFQAAMADMFDANTGTVEALAKLAAQTSLSASTVAKIVNGEKGPSQDEIEAVRAALKVKPGKNPKKETVDAPEAGKSITITVDGFAEHTTKPFTIFTADPEAGPRKYTRDDLQVIADNFNGRIKRIRNEDLKNPLVIGHEEDQTILKRSDLPAAGWVDKVWVDDDRLMGQANRVPDTVRSWIDGGQYRTWSAEIYRDYHGLGPALRRVALLGADIPHKKDLGELAWENNHEEPSFETFTGVNMPQLPQPGAPAPAPAQDQNNNGIPDVEEDVQITGKMKKTAAAAAAPAAPAAAAVPMPQVPQPPRPPQRFAEEDMSKIAELTEMLQIERKLRKEVEAEKRANEIIKFAEEKAKEGLWTGDTTTKVIDGLKKLDGVDKFDEGESATDVAMRLLADVAPKQQRSSTPLSAGAVTSSPDDESDLKEFKQDFAEYQRMGGTATLERYAENNGFDLPETK
jgi:transcriptional regulator with XRE-family HTH domain